MANINDLLESTALTEEAKSEIQSAWNAQISEAREELTAELREEFAQRFEHDKAQIVEAMDKFISETLEEEIKEFANDKNELVKDRVKYKESIGAHAKLLDKFVTETLANEIKELKADRDSHKANIGKLENFVIEQVADEISEFHKDKQELVEKKVQLISEGRKKLQETKEQFIKKAAGKVETVINDIIKNEITQYRDDIKAARENDFGRRIFESVASEYASTYLNENSEVKQIREEMAEMQKSVEEAKVQIEESAKAKDDFASKLRIAEDKYQRNETLTGLMTNLNKDKKQIMNELLESVQTDKLEQAFNKYLPSVLNEDASVRTEKKALNESVTTEHTGNRVAPASNEQEAPSNDVVDISEIKKLAGLN
jgi:hypothetical protein